MLIGGDGQPLTDPTRHDAPGATPPPPAAAAVPPPRDERGRFVTVDETALQSEDEQKAATSAAFQRWLAQRHQPAPARPALLDELNRQQWQLLGEVARGFLEDGLLDTLENLPRTLLEMTGPVQLYRLVQLLRQAAANPQGFWAGLKEIEWERLQAVLAKLKELTTTPRGAGELLFDVVSIWLGGEALTAFKESALGIKLAARLKGAPKPPLEPKPTLLPALPERPPNPITAAPGEMQTVDPKLLTSGERAALEEGRLATQRGLMRKPGTPITVYQDGVIYDGHHRAALAAWAGDEVDVLVRKGERISRTNLPPHMLRVIKPR